MTRSVSEMDSGIVGGDFNNLEALKDQQGWDPEFGSIAHAKQSEWESFLFATGGRDSWRELSFYRWPRSLDFSWGYQPLVSFSTLICPMLQICTRVGCSRSRLLQIGREDEAQQGVVYLNIEGEMKCSKRTESGHDQDV